MSVPNFNPGPTSAPVPSEHKADYWTPEMESKKQELLAAIREGRANELPLFDKQFTKYVLNSPPNNEHVKVERVPGKAKAEVEHIPLNQILLIADELFASWSIVDVNIYNAEKKNKGGQIIPLVICTVKIEVFYPVTNHRRAFIGMSDSPMTSSTAGEMLKSAALKNAFTQIGRHFGNRALYAKQDAGYEEDGEPVTKRSTEIIGKPDVPPPPPVQPQAALSAPSVPVVPQVPTIPTPPQP